MKISIITVSLNSAQTIEGTIKSVLSQKHKDIEYIVIDGGSSDGTIDIIKKYQKDISYFISEQDGGIYEAMNKGIKKATGDVVSILNSDDFYKDSEVLNHIVKSFEDNPGVGGCYGDLIIVKRNNIQKIFRHWIAGEYSLKKFRYGWLIPHPTLFVRRSVYEKIGLFRQDFKIAGDYEFMVRALVVNNIKMVYIPKILTCMRPGGYTSKNIYNKFISWKEQYLAWLVNGVKPPFYLVSLRFMRKMPEYFHKQVINNHAI